MANPDSSPSPGEDRQRGSHGGDHHADQTREPRRSSQAAGKDPGRDSPPADAVAPEDPVIRGPRRNPVDDSGLERRPPNWRATDRGSREGDPDADSVMPGREFGAGGGVDDGPNEAGGDASKPHPR